jgi:hypothetical protein
MKPRHFFTGLFLVSLAAAGTLYLLYSLGNYQPGYFPALGFLFFFLFCLLIFFLARRAGQSTDRNRFTAVIMGMIFIKLLGTILLVVIFDRLIGKLALHHIVSFLISYLYFTIFEVYFMSKLARMRPG